MRDFNGLPKWHPMIRDCRIEEEQASDRVSCLRHFRIDDGCLLRERLLELSDHRQCMVYSTHLAVVNRSGLCEGFNL